MWGKGYKGIWELSVLSVQFCCEAKTAGMIHSENDSLKNELHKLKNEEFVRKKKVNKLNEYGYPKFPVYENDDDWLWFCP